MLAVSAVQGNAEVIKMYDWVLGDAKSPKQKQKQLNPLLGMLNDGNT